MQSKSLVLDLNSTCDPVLIYFFFLIYHEPATQLQFDPLKVNAAAVQLGGAVCPFLWNSPQWTLESSLPPYKWRLPVEVNMARWPAGYPAIVKVVSTASATLVVRCCVCTYCETAVLQQAPSSLPNQWHRGPPVLVCVESEGGRVAFQ